MSKSQFKMARRRFLGVLAAAPLAAKTAVEQSAEVVTGVKPAVGPNVYPHTPYNTAKKASRNALANLISRGTVPEIQLAQWRSYAKGQERVLDMDIAALRSVSLSVKVSMQIERNYQKILHEHSKGHLEGLALRAFRNSLGLDDDYHLDDD
jgi:hypothetical protein